MPPFGATDALTQMLQFRKKYSVSDVTKEDLQEHFHQSIDFASLEMRIGVTTLKKLCRRHGILRWPYRKVQQILRLGKLSQAGLITAHDYLYLLELLLELNLGMDNRLWSRVDPDATQGIFAAVQECVRLTEAALATDSLDPIAAAAVARELEGGGEGNALPVLGSGGALAGLRDPEASATLLRQLVAVVGTRFAHACAPAARPAAATGVWGTPQHRQAAQELAGWMRPRHQAAMDKPQASMSSTLEVAPPHHSNMIDQVLCIGSPQQQQQYAGGWPARSSMPPPTKASPGFGPGRLAGQAGSSFTQGPAGSSYTSGAGSSSHVDGSGQQLCPTPGMMMVNLPEAQAQKLLGMMLSSSMQAPQPRPTTAWPHAAQAAAAAMAPPAATARQDPTNSSAAMLRSLLTEALANMLQGGSGGGGGPVATYGAGGPPPPLELYPPHTATELPNTGPLVGLHASVPAGGQEQQWQQQQQAGVLMHGNSADVEHELLMQLAQIVREGAHG